MSAEIRSSAIFVTLRDRRRHGRPPSLFTYYATSGPEVVDPAAMFVYITWP